MMQVHKQACAIFNEKKEDLEAIDKMHHPTLILAVNKINGFLKGCHGKFKSVIEELIKIAPILAKHNPFYSGSFNGNDCLRLMQNYEILFTKLQKATKSETEEIRSKIEDIATRHE